MSKNGFQELPPVDEHIQIGKDPLQKTSVQNVSRELATIKNRTRESLLHIVDESFSNYEDIDLTEQEAARLSKTLRRLSTGSSSFVVLNCQGASCEFASRCPLVQMPTSLPDGTPNPHGKAPVDRDCLLETSVLRDSLTNYIQEYEVDPANYTEVNIVAELAEIEALLWRINMQLGSGESSMLVINQTIGFDRASGRAITQQQVAPLFEQKIKLATRKSRLIKLMVGDRQEKYKKEAALKQKPSEDASSQMSEIKKQLQQLQGRINKPEIIEASVVSAEDFMLNDNKKDSGST